MANSTLTDSSLRLEFGKGTEQGSEKQLITSKSFHNVKTTATSDQLYAIAQAVASLQKLPLLTIQRKDSSKIVEA
ncbi:MULTISPECIES: DUF1659 domain-containing protein [unclassified Virgibacillus]|uniref:DUF1659 domain-containing protein n=1 Tax=unclassified Virgibacillus TaxID=2620237 RepID=UPI00090BB45F|nr:MULTISPECIES: DUF1659 domain-containing protein [unclassified Virgibacillus]API91744.1 hypothetical protein BKP57_07830 [Virgibacillus sp. 6R]MBS7427865.1 DUF1659 domain-containing protein [Virgibacillus sp. 19R1-5]